MTMLIHSSAARRSSIKNIIKKLDMGIRASCEDGLTSFEISIPTNTVLEIQGWLDHEGYIIEITTQPREFTRLLIRWG